MQKKDVRYQKHLYGQRWEILKYNRKHKDKQIITLHDKLILSKLQSGTTLSLDFIGIQYQNIIPNMSFSGDMKKYNNLLLDQIRFRYKTLDEIFEEIKNLTYLHAEKNASIIVGFNYQFVKFNRLKNNYQKAIENLLEKLADNYIMIEYELKAAVPKTNPYGDCFFIFKFRNSHE